MILDHKVIPWSSPNIWKEIVDYYENMHSPTVFEYGTGASSISHVNNLLPLGGKYIGVEGDQNWFNIKPILPVASGGLSPLHIPELMEILGSDAVYQFGGGCHGHPEGTKAGARAIRQAISAVLEGYTLKEYAKDHNELARALEIWG